MTSFALRVTADGTLFFMVIKATTRLTSPMPPAISPTCFGNIQRAYVPQKLVSHGMTMIVRYANG